MKFNGSLKATLGVTGLSLVLALTLAGCGKDKANATKNYSQLNLVPVHNQTKGDQINLSYAMRITFVETGSDSSISHFTEGVPGQAQVKLEILDPAIPSAQLKLTDGTYPEGMTLTASTATPGIWILNWTPPAGDGEKDIQVEAHPVNPTDSRLSSGIATRRQAIIVQHSNKLPMVVDKKIPTKVDEGKVTDFTVTVSDPADITHSQPSLIIDPYPYVGNDTENLHYDGRDRVLVKNVSPGPNGSYVYQLTFDSTSTEGHKIATTSDKTQPSALYCFKMRVAGKGGFSPDSQPCIEVMYTAQRPFAAWSSDPQNTVGTQDITIGDVNHPTFTVKTVTGRGDVKVVTSDKFTKVSWPSVTGGEPKLDCIAGTDASTQTCTFNWTPACKGKLPKQLDLVMTNSLGSKVPTTAATKLSFNFVKKDGLCDAAQTATTKAGPADVVTKVGSK